MDGSVSVKGINEKLCNTRQGCRHIHIAHCISGRQQCGGSPDGIKCTECVDPYYSAGYNNGCKDCSPITQCEYRHCTSADDTVCKSCYEDRTIFKRTHSDTKCERMCAFNNHYCWPGSCRTSELTKDCQCAPGFKKKYITGTAIMSGETSCQPDTSPSIETCGTVFVGTNGEQKRTESSGNSTACNALQDTWGNYQLFRIQFNMVSHFEVDITAYTSLRPSFIKEETFGISDTTVYVKRKPISGSDIILSTHNQIKDSTSSRNVQTTVYNAGNLTVSSSTHSVSNGEALCISYEAKGGGYLKSIDTRGSAYKVSNPVPYTKVTEARQLCFRYDNAPPEHCLKLGTCTTEPLVLESRITRSPISEITFSGWSDPIPPGGNKRHVSSIESYLITVNKVMPSKVLQKVDTAIVFQKQVTSSVHNMTVNLTSDTPMMFSIMLEVKDVADNVRQTRRFLLYDNSTFIETRTDKPCFVSSASTQSNFTWQTHHHEICLYWVDHFYNKFYLDNAILNPVEPDPNGLISGLYEQNTGLLPVKGTPNIAGIIKYEISWALNDNPDSSEFDVPDFLNQNFCKQFDLKDGQRYTFNVKPVDIAGNTHHENRTVYIDRSHPHINNIWLKKDGYKLLFVHDKKDLSKMQMTFDALDQHSGLLMIKWEFGIADTSTKLLSQSLAVNRLSNTSCPVDSTNCYCPDIGDCEIYNYTIPLNKLNALDRQTGDHNRNYSFTIVVTNNALLTNTEHVDILVDDSPPEVGVAYEGPVDAKDIDYTSGDSFNVHWHGFIDHESGIKLYRVGLSHRCLATTELYNFTVVTDIEFYKELPFTETNVLVPANFTGKRYVTVVALNNAMDPSEPVCSDGITRDLSPPELRNLTILNGAWSESILCHNGGIWLMHSLLKQIALLNTSSCVDICKTHSEKEFANILPTAVTGRKDYDVSDFLCSTLPKYSNKTIIYLPNDHIVLQWDIEEDGSQVDDFLVGFGKDPTEGNSPSIADYKSTGRKQMFRRKHEGIGSNELFYIFIKAVNKAGLDKTVTLGPVLIDVTPPKFKQVPNVTIVGEEIVVGWEIDTFYDTEQTERIDHIFFQIGHDDEQVTPVLEWRLDSSQPCSKFTGGCFSYPLRRLQTQDTDLGLSFYITLHVYNNAGHFTSVRTSLFQLPSRYPPGHALVYDIDPNHYGDAKQNDVDVHFTESTLCAKWTGFKHHESLSLEFGIGTSNATDDIVAFQQIPTVDMFCKNTSSKFFGTKFFALVRANCSGGSTLSSSNGVTVLDKLVLLTPTAITVGDSCNNIFDFEQILLFSSSDMTFLVSHPMEIGHTYSMFSSQLLSLDIRSIDGLITKSNQSITFVPYQQYPNITLTNTSKTNGSLTIRFEKCTNHRVVPYSNSLLTSWFIPQTVSVSLRFSVGIYVTNRTIKNGQLLVPFEPSDNPSNHTFRDVNLKEHDFYNIAVKVCSKVHCLAPMLSKDFQVEITSPHGKVNEAQLELPDKGSCFILRLKWAPFKSVGNLLFYQWAVTRDGNGNLALTEWHTVDSHTNTSIYKIEQCVDLPVHGHSSMFACVRAFSITGRQGIVCTTVVVSPTKTYGTDTVYDFDSSSPNWPTIMEALPSSNVGDMYQLVHDNEFQFGERRTSVAGAIFYASERNTTWSLMTKRYVPRECDIDSNCKLSVHSSNGYVVFNTEDVDLCTAYYICAYSNITTVHREYATETLGELSACSNGFILDNSPPLAGHVYVQNVNNYITEPQAVQISWETFTENIDASLLGYPDKIKMYSYQIGTGRGRDDIVKSTNVGLANIAVCDIGDVNDGSVVYVTVNGTNHAGLSTSSASDKIIIDSSPPATGRIVLMNNVLDSTYINDESISVNLVDFEDPHSGIAYYRVGIGSHVDTMDTQSAISMYTDIFKLTLNEETIRDGHQYFIVTQAVNRAGLMSPIVATTFTVDKTPPTGGQVLDGPWTYLKDTDFQADITKIEGHWKGFVDTHSGILYYSVGLGTQRYKFNVRPMTDVGLTEDILWKGPFIPGQKYYITVEACNIAGLCTTRSSDGVTLDNSPPIKGLVRVGSGTAHQSYLAEATSLHIHWIGFQDPQSDVDHFKTCVGNEPFACDVVDRFNVLLQSNIIRSNINLPRGRDLFATVWFFNRVGMNVSECSEVFKVDDTPPHVVIKPEFLLDYNSIDGMTVNAQWEKSIIRLFWQFLDDDSPIVTHRISLVTHHEGHTPVEHMLLGSENNLTINLDGKNWLNNGDTYSVIVTSCNAAGLCTTDQTYDLLIDSTGPHMGGFKPPMTWSNFKDTRGNVFTNLTLSWYGFYDQESEVENYFITVSRDYSGQELTNGVFTYKVQHHSSEHSATLNLSDFTKPDELIILTIWAQNKVGLNSTTARVSVNVLSTVGSGIAESLRGTLELEKHSCDIYFCNKDCTCAVIGKPCVDIATNFTCQEINSTKSDNKALPTFNVHGGFHNKALGISASSACLAGGWLEQKNNSTSVVHRFEWSIGVRNEKPGVGVFDLDEIPWNDIGLRTEFIHCLPLNKSFTHDVQYIVYIKVWYGPGTFSVFSSDPIVIDHTPPSVRRGHYVIDSDSSCSKDLDFIDWTDTISACWKGVFSEQQGNITHYVVSLGTSSNADDVFTRTDVGLDSSLHLLNLTLKSGTHYYFTVTAVNSVGLHASTTSDGFVVDTDTPTSGVVFNTVYHQDSEFQSSSSSIGASWHGFQDRFSGITSYIVALVSDTNANASQLNWTNTGLQTSYNFDNYTLENMNTYYAVVKASDAAGHVSDLVVSNGITIDDTSPKGCGCSRFNSSVRYYVQNAKTIDVIKDILENSFYRIRGDIYSKSVSSLVLTVGRFRRSLPLTRTDNGTLEFSYLFLSSKTSLENISLSLISNDHSNVSWSFTIDDCIEYVEDPQSAIAANQIGTNTLSVDMFIMDKESGMEKTLVGAGTVPGGFQVMALSEIHNRENNAIISAHLQHGDKVYVTVIAKNNAGTTSTFTSKSVTIDHTPPVVTSVSSTVVDVSLDPLDPILNVVNIVSKWNSTDDETDVKYCLCMLGSLPELSDIQQPWVSQSLTSCKSNNVTVNHGDVLHVTVKCINSIELSSTASSSPVVVSTHAPSIDEAIATFIPTNKYSTALFANVLEQNPVQSNKTCLQIRWKGFKDDSLIKRYEYRIQDETDTVTDWSDAAGRDMASVRGISLQSASTYTVNVRAINTGDFVSDSVNASVTIAGEKPLLTGKPVNAEWQAGSLYLDWANVFSIVHGVPVSYSLVVGSRHGFTDILDINYINGHVYDVTIPDGTLISEHIHELYIKIVCTYATGLYSVYTSSYKLE